MSYRFYAGIALAGLLTLPLTTTAADPAPKAAEQQIYGSQLMTQQERLEHRARLQAAKTAEEREQIRKEHHERMQQRAKEKGLRLPEQPAMPAGGMGPGPRGGGMGGGGMGGGPRR